jgi:hypothetical protein
LLASLFSIHVVEIRSSSRDADPEVGWIQEGDGGGGHECQQQRLEDEHREDPLVKDTSRETDVENDQLYQPMWSVSVKNEDATKEYLTLCNSSGIRWL